MDFSVFGQTVSSLWEGLCANLAAFAAQEGVAALLDRVLGTVLQFLLPVLALLVVIRCARSLLQGKLETEAWGYLTDARGERKTLHHWEVLLGRSRRCDVVLSDPTVSRSHAALIRDDKGHWSLYPLRTKNGVFLNGHLQLQPARLQSGDLIGLGGCKLSFRPLTPEEEAQQARSRTRPGKMFSPGMTLFLLTLFQAILCLKLGPVVEPEYELSVYSSFGVLCLLMWLVYAIYRICRRTGFEIETLAFFLTSLCLAVTADSDPAGLYKQLMSVVLGLVLFFALSILLRDLDRAKALRWPAAIGAGGLLAFNLLLGETLFGARNWVSLGPISFQPSELVKVVFVLVGATTLDRMFSRRNLVFTLVFSAYCVGCLALMSDFGTALIFFVAFLAIAFLRSGDLPSVAFMTAAAVFACFLILQFKPYIANRFAVYRHVWEDTSGLGYQQTRTLSALASGGLFGQGLGNGWLKKIGAANTDLVFGVLAEELGLIIAVLTVVVIVLLALFTVKSAATGRSSFYVIAACATAMIFLVQTMLNVFGSTDLLPLTGVTLPFVSCGGTSMMACWCLLAYIKAADTRQNAGIAIRLPKRSRKGTQTEVPEEAIPIVPDHPFASSALGRTPDDLPETSTQSTSRLDPPTEFWNPDDFSAELFVHLEQESDRREEETP